MNTLTIKLRLIHIFSILLTFSIGVFSQDSFPFETPFNTKDVSLIKFQEPVLVTARKRNEKMFEVPVMVSTLSEKDINTLAIQNIRDIEKASPSFYIQPSGYSHHSTRLAIRGVGSDKDTFNVEPEIAFYLDGAYVHRNNGLLMDLFDIEQVQILRGPQGTLFGKNSVGGAVLVNYKEPNLDKQEGKFSLGISDRERLITKVMLNYPIFDDLGLRILASKNIAKGYIKNLDTNTYYGNDNLVLGRISLLYKLNEKNNVIISYHSLRSKGKGLIADCEDYSTDKNKNNLAPQFTVPWVNSITIDSKVGQGQTISHSQLNACDSSSPFKSFADPRFGDDENISQYLNFKLNSHTSFGDISIIYSTNTFEDYLASWDMGFERISTSEYGRVGPRTQLSSANSLELRLNKDLGPFFWTLGYFNSKEDGDVSFDLQLYEDIRPYSEVSQVAAGVSALGSHYDNLDIYHKSSRIFSEAVYAVNHKANLTVGLSQSWDKKRLDITSWSDANKIPETIGTGLTDQQCPAGKIYLGTCKSTQKYDNLDGRLILDYKIDKNHLIYTSYSTAYTSGGFNNSFPIQEFEAQKIGSFEIGYKGYLFNEKLKTNVSVFSSNYDNRRDTECLIDSLGAVVCKTRNIGNVSINGVEFDTTYLLMDNIEIRTWGSSFKALLDQPVTRYDYRSQTVGVLSPNPSSYSVNDAPLPGPSRHFGLSLNITLFGSLETQLSYQFYDKQVISNYLSHPKSIPMYSWNNINIERDPYELIDFTANYSFNNSLLVTFYINNLGNETYSRTTQDASAGGTLFHYYAPKREIGINFTKYFSF